MDTATKEALVQTIWGVDLTADIDKKLAAYFRYCDDEEVDVTDEALFFVVLLKSKPEASKMSLKAMVGNMHQAWSSRRSMPSEFSGKDKNQHHHALERSKQILTLPTFKVEDIAITRAVRIMLGIDVAANSSEIIGNSMIIWDDAKSLQDIVEQSLPGFRHPTLPGRSLSSQTTSAVMPFNKKKLRARHLRNYAKIEVVWTKHLPDHLELDGKVLRVFQLASLLEMSINVVDKSKTELADCLQQGCLPYDFLAETLMTLTLIFPQGKDKGWLKSQIKPHFCWSGWAWLKTAELDPRLAAPFDAIIDADVGRPLTNTRELHELYPHWARRLQALYEEADEPTPRSALEKLAEGKRATWRTYWIAVIALGLAAVFGALSVVLGALQLWVAWCQWQVPNGSHLCGTGR